VTDEETARLLRLASARVDVPADRAARVRGAVHDRWRARTRRRALRRRAIGGSVVLAAAASVMLVATWQQAPANDAAQAARFVATVLRVDGRLDRFTPRNERFDVVGVGVPGVRLEAGESVATGPTARAVLQLPDGASVRISENSRVRIISPDVLELGVGTLYVDTGRESSGLQVKTPFGTAHDIGTQFEVRVDASALRVRVRTGLVELRRAGDTISARPGTELTATGSSTDTRQVPAHGPEWDWVVDLAPPYAIDGRPLSGFLEHVSREHAWTLRYGDPQIARDASGIIMSGSVEGLSAREALGVVLATSGLAHRLEKGELLIVRDRTNEAQP
jgi:ferric-dicitrate binding protein FerR (iron transport regulator)